MTGSDASLPVSPKWCLSDFLDPLSAPVHYCSSVRLYHPRAYADIYQNCSLAIHKWTGSHTHTHTHTHTHPIIHLPLAHTVEVKHISYPPPYCSPLTTLHRLSQLTHTHTHTPHTHDGDVNETSC